MQDTIHQFHIPVMGLGFTIDTPIRVAHFGISSVMSIVDDVLIEKIRKYYSEKFNVPYFEIKRKEEDSRAKRITAYLNLVNQIVHDKFEALKSEPFLPDTDKTKYFEMLPDNSKLKSSYKKMIQLKDNVERMVLAEKITKLMKPGSIDVNIMSKVDKQNYSINGEKLGDEFSDAKAALRGYAKSDLNSSIVFSAGFNRSLISYISQFSDFYRDKSGELKKKIIIKVSDFRSALIQGKFLAAKGLEVSEFRIESGLNCGGHAFASQGLLLPSLLKEFKEKKDQLATQLQPLILSFYKNAGLDYPESAIDSQPLITVQGGIGTNGEARRLQDEYGCDSIGWGTPFLLVPEATCVDKGTLELLIKAKKDDQYLSEASPLGIPFNNLRMTSSELWTKERAETTKPGSTCPKGFLKLYPQKDGEALCVASNNLLAKKIKDITESNKSELEKVKEIDALSIKVCLCEHLSNGALKALNIINGEVAPKAVCPGPNIAWFDREYSLKEMIDHIYGRRESLVSFERPHMFCQEVELYVDYLERLVAKTDKSETEKIYNSTFRDNLEDGMDYILTFADKIPFEGENLGSIIPFILKQRERLREIYPEWKEIKTAAVY
jgi:hypothetical protein